MKQQDQIHTRLIREQPNGVRISVNQERIYRKCIQSIHDKNKSQVKTLKETILPRIALYKALRTECEYSEHYGNVRKYMTEAVGRKSTKLWQGLI